MVLTRLARHMGYNPECHETLKRLALVVRILLCLGLTWHIQGRRHVAPLFEGRARRELEGIGAARAGTWVVATFGEKLFDLTHKKGEESGPLACFKVTSKLMALKGRRYLVGRTLLAQEALGRRGRLKHKGDAKVHWMSLTAWSVQGGMVATGRQGGGRGGGGGAVGEGCGVGAGGVWRAGDKVGGGGGDEALGVRGGVRAPGGSGEGNLVTPTFTSRAGIV